MMKTYPYIGKSDIGNITLFTDEKSGLSIFNSGAYSNNEYRTDWVECGFKNITHEYLANTYGEVVSHEHAEFIIELAENESLGVYVDSPKINRAFFTFNESSGLFFYDSEEDINKDRCKKITIPLPPKAKPKIYPQENLGETPKHFDCVCNKCGGKCCTGQCDKQESSEWPQIGDEVCWSNGKRKGELKSICDGWAWIKDDGGEFVSLMAKFIKKPKTPEEELRDNLESEIKSMVNFTNYNPRKIAEWIIGGEIDGLSYDIKKKPQ